MKRFAEQIKKTVLALLLAAGVLGSFPIGAAASPSPLPALSGLLEEKLLPVLAITTKDGLLPSDEDTEGTLVYYETDGAVISTPIEINLRGNTSRRFPKQSYRVKIVDERGIKSNLSLAGLRRDDDWILNPMYSDTSKVREAVSYWLWGEINSCGQAAASTSLAYAEVFLNGDYYGLYAIEERIDRKQVNADKGSGILYKVIANDQPTVETLLHWQSEDPCHGFELAFSGAAVASPWLPAADYIAFLQEQTPPGSAFLSLPNAVDFGLWSMLVQARDCHFKNQFIHCALTGNGYELYRIPWDVNHTLGDLWNGSAAEENFTDYAYLPLVTDDAFPLLASGENPEFPAAVYRRWQALRADAITEDRITAYARALFDRLDPAIRRDTARWPQCGMGEGNAANIRDIESYVAQILPRMDAWIGELAPQTKEMEINADGNHLDR